MTNIRVTGPNRRRFRVGRCGAVSLHVFWGFRPLCSQAAAFDGTHHGRRFLRAAPPTLWRGRRADERVCVLDGSSRTVPGAGGCKAVLDAQRGPADGSVMVLTPAAMVWSLPARLQVTELRSAGFCGDHHSLHHGHGVCGWPAGPGHGEDAGRFHRLVPKQSHQSSYGTPGAGSPLHFLGVMLLPRAELRVSPRSLPGHGALHKACWRPDRLLRLADRPVCSAYPVRAPRALATTGAQRSSLLPDVPTVAEADFPIAEFAEWFGILTPAHAQRHRRGAQQRAAGGTCNQEVQAGLANQSADVGARAADFAREIKAPIAGDRS